VVDVSIAMEQREGAFGLFPTAVLREPTRGAGKEYEAQAQQRAGEHLKTPGNAEGRGASDEAAAIGNVEHDHDTPGDSMGPRSARISGNSEPQFHLRPLLATDQTTSDFRARNLSDVDRDLGTANTDCQTVDESSHDQHTDVLRGTGNDRSDNPESDFSGHSGIVEFVYGLPNNRANLNGVLSSHDI
jgi:hypothetical protein